MTLNEDSFLPQSEKFDNEMVNTGTGMYGVAQWGLTFYLTDYRSCRG